MSTFVTERENEQAFFLFLLKVSVKGLCLFLQRTAQSQSCRLSTRTSPLNSSSARPSCWRTESLCCSAERKRSSSISPAGAWARSGYSTASPEQLFVSCRADNRQMCLFVQPSENVGFEQHSWESREPLVQLLQALHARLHERTLQRTWEQRGGLPLSAPQSACFKMTIRTFSPHAKLIGSIVIFIPKGNSLVYDWLYSIWLLLLILNCEIVFFFVLNGQRLLRVTHFKLLGKK